MFDWNDEELANIIWGELGESDDHIVPYPEASEDYSDKKERNQEAASNKPTEQKTSATRRKLNGTYNLETKEGISGSGFEMDSWVDLSSSKADKTDRNCMDTDVSNKLTAISKVDSSRDLLDVSIIKAQAGQLQKAPEMYHNTQGSKEQGEFVDYGWDNIGSFDDLDRIFSTEDQLFGKVNIGISDELWSSSKDFSVTTNSQGKSFPSFGSEENAPKHADVKTEYLQQNPSYKLGYGKISVTSSQGLQRANEIGENFEFTEDKSGHATKEQGSKQKKLLKDRRKTDVRETRMVQDFCGKWPSSTYTPNHFETNMTSPSMRSSPSSSLSQYMQLYGPQSLQYQHMSNPFQQRTAYGTLGNPYPSVPVLSHIRPGELQHQPLLSGYDISPVRVSCTNKPVDCSVNRLIMTPQEKIEKLRRRQQMQAMLAIKKQQQQFGNQVSCTGHSTSKKCREETQIQNFEKSAHDAEDISTIPAPDSNSPLEQNDSSAVSLVVDDYSMENKILYRLQEIISKLDIKIRICMRDSLFRLAQSAMQRHYSSETSNTNKSGGNEQELGASGEINSHSRYVGLPDFERETNSIDRTVAHLLFHRPLELSGKHVGGPQSPIFSKLMHENIATTGLPNSPKCSLADVSNDKPFISRQGSKNSRGSDCPCADTSENVSNKDPKNRAVLEAEASQ